jgi:hypothetical protein
MTRLITFLAAVYVMLTHEPRKKKQPASQPLDNMVQQKRHLIARIQSMKYISELKYYQYEIHDFVNRFLFHPEIGAAKEELKSELQMQVNELSIPALINNNMKNI